MFFKSFLAVVTATFVFTSCAQVPSTNGDTINAPTGHPDPKGRANMVVSPYRPYNIIDVKGYRSGDIVGDPSTAIVNPSTGRREASTAKYFRIP
jgi:hypothetical protein